MYIYIYTMYAEGDVSGGETNQGRRRTHEYFIHPSFHSFIYPFYLSYLSIYLSIRPSVHPSINLSNLIYLSINLHIFEDFVLIGLLIVTFASFS